MKPLPLAEAGMRAPSTETQGLVIFKPDVIFLLEQGKEPWTVTNYMTHPWHPGQKRALDSLELELQMVVSHHVGTEN